MPIASAGEQGGYLLSLMTESFAVRALLGSLAASALAALAVRYRLVQSRRARRLVVLAPVLSAAVAGVVSLVDAEPSLPQLWMTSAATSEAANQLVDLLWDLRAVANDRPLDVLAVGYATVVAFLLLRRAVGAAALRRALRGGVAPGADEEGLTTLVGRLAERNDLRAPEVVLLDACPGGAFTARPRRPVVAVDRQLLTQLDEHELEGLLAHEFAHISRRDTLVGILVGVFRDLTFFLPPMYLVARWLRQEQEESADELASTSTGRPAALASGILKVWETNRHRGLPMTCAAVRTSRGASAGLVTARVERLIDDTPVRTRLRQSAEIAVAAGVCAVGAGAALIVPAWLAAAYDTNGLAFGYVTVDSSVPVESPAFETFRTLAAEPEDEPRAVANFAPSADTGSDPTAAQASTAPGQHPGLVEEKDTGCPCVESTAQLRAGTPATGQKTSNRMLWRRATTDAWELDAFRRQRSVHPARPLLTWRDSGPQVGVFVVGASKS